ncbi:MAG: hypothetical protein FP816_14080 [Desulfobacteraceae bacterium]|nr:hypothetical protein [Desulfobacteraceae bacterium]
MNPNSNYISDNQVKQIGFEILKKELGVNGFIRFIQQFETGQGNYTLERDEWQKDYDIEKIAEGITKMKTAK